MMKRFGRTSFRRPSYRRERGLGKALRIGIETPAGVRLVARDLRHRRALGENQAVAGEPDDDAIEGRAHRGVADPADQVAPPHEIADLERRMPDAARRRDGEGGIVAGHRALAGLLRDAVMDGAAMGWRRLEGEVAVFAHGEMSPQSDGQADIVSVIGNGGRGLEPGVDQQLDAAQGEQIAQLQLRHRHAGVLGGDLGEMHGVIGSSRAHPVQFAFIVIKGVGEGHAAAEHRRAGLVGENDVIAALAQFHRQRRSNFVGAQDHRHVGVGGRDEIREGSRVHGHPATPGFIVRVMLPMHGPRHGGWGRVVGFPGQTRRVRRGNVALLTRPSCPRRDYALPVCETATKPSKRGGPR